VLFCLFYCYYIWDPPIHVARRADSLFFTEWKVVVRSSKHQNFLTVFVLGSENYVKCQGWWFLPPPYFCLFSKTKWRRIIKMVSMESYCKFWFNKKKKLKSVENESQRSPTWELIFTLIVRGACAHPGCRKLKVVEKN